MRYDAARARNPEAWLELDEQDRIDTVIAYHRRAKLGIGVMTLLHVVVLSRSAS